MDNTNPGTAGVNVFSLDIFISLFNDHQSVLLSNNV